ncbi:MAG TPA: peptidylprolyl isomerase [Desulfobacteria bacterium]|nr:peptidylprolyl isomerase [Desulfobacteria bacterium]
MKKLIITVLVGLLMLSGLACTKREAPQDNSGQSEQEEPKTAVEPFKPDPNKKYPQVTIEMADGKIIKMELYPEVAPNTVNNFLSLVKKGFYDGTIFHRVIPGFMIQGGDPQGTGGGGPGYAIKGEFKDNGVENNLLHERGTVSMARTDDPNSAGSQFFIMVDKADYLDGKYAAFGKVIQGMDVADEIVSVERNPQDKPLKEQKMKKVIAETFGKDYPEPEKVK